jgi:hypothetical protein
MSNAKESGMGQAAGSCSEFNWVRRQIARRDFLRLGGVSLVSGGLLNVLAGRTQAAARPARIKSCLLLFQVGGVSQTDTFDMKPDAEDRIRGEFKPISTNVPGMHVCELLPQVSQQMDKLCVVRSVHHRMLCHNPAIYTALSGREVGDSLAVSVQTAANRDDYPHFGSVVARFRDFPKDLPPSVSLPYQLRNGPTRSPGQHAGFLGPAYDPFLVLRDPSAADFHVDELKLQEQVDAPRLSARRRLLASLNAQTEWLEKKGPVESAHEYYRQAIELLSTERTKQAFDISQESDKLRDRYGRNVVGQSTLLGRRLVEAGVPFVTVYSPVANVDEPSWDTHLNNFPRLKDQLLPPADQALSALLEDMHSRGLLDETLVIWAGEFGRTPEIGVKRSNNSNNTTGRDHWPHCYTILLAGGGVPGGRYYGSSDGVGWYPRDNPIYIGDLAATIYDAFGIDSKQLMHDSLGRPHVLADGEPVRELFGGA